MHGRRLPFEPAAAGWGRHNPWEDHLGRREVASSCGMGLRAKVVGFGGSMDGHAMGLVLAALMDGDQHRLVGEGRLRVVVACIDEEASDSSGLLDTSHSEVAYARKELVACKAPAYMLQAEEEPFQASSAGQDNHKVDKHKHIHERQLAQPYLPRQWEGLASEEGEQVEVYGVIVVEVARRVGGIIACTACHYMAIGGQLRKLPRLCCT